jgi:hypothetical protein
VRISVALRGYIGRDWWETERARIRGGGKSEDKGERDKAKRRSK